MKYFISKNLAKPSSGIGGYLISKWLTKYNRHLEHAASQLCNIQPHHQVLEVGYGPGLGLKESVIEVSEGSGVIHGIDISTKMYELAKRNLQEEIRMRKVQLHTASVMDIPYPDNKFDSIFHCNCYYFWPEMDPAIRELHRVLKPDKTMVATISLKRMQMIVHKGFMQYGNIDPDRYMKSLENNGFNEVYMKEIQTDDKKFEAIYATAKK